MMNGNQGEISMAVRPGIIPCSAPRPCVSDKYKSSLSPFPFDHSLQRFLRVFFRAEEDETRSLLLGLASKTCKIYCKFFFSCSDSFALYYFASRSYQTRDFTRDFRNFRIRAREIAPTFLGQHPIEVAQTTNGRAVKFEIDFEQCRISWARARQSFSSLTNKIARDYDG